MAGMNKPNDHAEPTKVEHKKKEKKKELASHIKYIHVIGVRNKTNTYQIQY